MKKQKQLFTYVSGGEKEVELSELEVELMNRIKKAKLSPDGLCTISLQ